MSIVVDEICCQQVLRREMGGYVQTGKDRALTRVMEKLAQLSSRPTEAITEAKYSVSAGQLRLFQ